MAPQIMILIAAKNEIANNDVEIDHHSGLDFGPTWDPFGDPWDPLGSSWAPKMGLKRVTGFDPSLFFLSAITKMVQK